MNLPVFGKAVVLAEGLVALVAFVGLLACVDALVHHEVGALGALERLLPAVGALLHPEVPVAAEGLAALAVLKG